MDKQKTSTEKLNRTLHRVSRILDDNNIDCWFVMFGTLLGVVRENNCISGDDDIDIMIHYNYNDLKNIFVSNGFHFDVNRKSQNILKSIPSNEYASFDFYMCEISKDNNYYSSWQNVQVNNVSIIKHKWQNCFINLPNDAERKLEKMYGKNWKTPIEYKHGERGEMSDENSIYNTKLKFIL
tara:strand:- start:7445 stop:7987 length:543 start_codon:yes stop_codon:yes gene_type:complete